MTSPFTGQEQTEKFSVEQVIAKGEGTVFRGAPNDDFSGGKTISPEFKKALNQ